MLLVVAVVGGAIFSLIQGQGIQDVTGFTNDGLNVEQTGITSDNNLNLVLRNVDPDKITVNSITISNGEREAYFLRGDRSINVGDTEVFTVNGIRSEGSGNLDVDVVYDSGSLDNLQASGTLSGRADLVAGKPVDISQPRNGGEWTWVDGNNYFGTDYQSEEGFYVMKYEARQDEGAFSEPSGQPWTDITFNNAVDECQALSTSNYSVSLITNTQWMTIARQVESQGQNWVDEDFGSTHHTNNKGLVKGWAESEAWDNSEPASDSTRSNLYNVGADQGASSGDEKHRRTYILGSGGIVWDFTGNVYEWVDMNGDGSVLTEGEIRSGGSAGFVESGDDYITPWGFNGVDDVRYEIGSSKDEYGYDQGLGAYYDSTSDDRVARRGGVWNQEYQAGPYTIDTLDSDSEGQSGTGFRCAAVPA